MSTDLHVEPAFGDPEHLEIAVDGMTCASCAFRIERRLNRIDGVTASVNYATERAVVDFDADAVQPAQLIQVIESIGFQAALPAVLDADDVAPTNDAAHRLRLRVLVAAALTVPVVLLSMVAALQFNGWAWVVAALTTPVVFWCGSQLHLAAWKNLRQRAATMDTLVSIGSLAAWSWSIAALILLRGDEQTATSHSMMMPLTMPSVAASLYFEAAAVVITFVLAGRYYEFRARREAGRALRAVAELGAKDVLIVLPDGRELQRPIAALQMGDRFVVKPGEKIATDGVVVDGSAEIDCQIITGESAPVAAAVGDEVIGATIVRDGRLIVSATHVGEKTALAQIARLIATAQDSHAPIQRLADRIASIFVPVVLALAVATFIAWLAVTGDAPRAFGVAIAVLIVACPCALGLATPMALLVGSGRGARLGLLLRGPQVLELSRDIDTIVLDKTGTITSGEMTVTDVVAADGESADDVLRLAAAVEAASEHHVARGIERAWHERSDEPIVISDFRSHDGLGVEARVEGRAVIVGRAALLAERGAPLDGALLVQHRELEQRGVSVTCVAWGGQARGLIALGDTIKPTSAHAIVQLRALGLEPVLLTGDNESAARRVAEQVGISNVIAGVLPAQKDATIAALQADGRIVAMVGDGVNDAPALARADLGIAIGTGTHVAMEASDLTIISGDLQGAGDAIRLSRQTLRTIRVNLFWAFAYNVAAIPLAMLGLLTPMVAGVAMSMSSVFVVTNSMRLRRFTPDRTAQ